VRTVKCEQEKRREEKRREEKRTFLASGVPIFLEYKFKKVRFFPNLFSYL
jgi:hypothetical protein